jgi:hypothetical protein
VAQVTFAERTAAVAGVGFNQRQAAFLVTVALHSGFCLRRQYAAFAGVEYGKNVRDFLDSLIARGIAARVTFRGDRGFIYHLFGRPIYAALRQDDNRNRRHASPALIARKLMLLDYVLSRPGLEWYATEREKVELFANEFNVPIHALPYRVYDSQHSERRTRRYCVQKLPVFVSRPSKRLYFICLVTEPDARDLRFFVREHSALLRELPAYTIVAVHAAHISNEAACRRAWERATDGTQPLPRLLDRATLEWYVQARRRIEQGALDALSVADIQRYRACETRARGPLDALYARWRSAGEPTVSALDARMHDTHPPDARQLLVHALPFRYEQFGGLPGVA